MLNHTRIDLSSVCLKLHIDPIRILFMLGIFEILVFPVILMLLNIPLRSTILISIATMLLTIIAFLLFFYRDPERKPLSGDNLILSPADGSIKYIKEINKGELIFSTKGKNKIKLEELTKSNFFSESNGYIIGVTMNLFDVHVNRAPIEGTVKWSKHNPGKFIRVTIEDFEILNESQTTVIEHEKGYMIGVIQIATFLVRGIESYLRDGDIVKIGDRIGRIKLGSQVDVIIPFSSIEIMVEPGDRVYAGESALAKLTCQ